MKKNEIYRVNNTIIRILRITDDKVLIIDCLKMFMPVWKNIHDLKCLESIEESALYNAVGFIEESKEDIDVNRRKMMYQRYTIIAGIIPFVGDKQMRVKLINRMSEEFEVTQQTIRRYLCRFLAIQNIQSLLPKERMWEHELTEDEKVMRWRM